MDTGSNMIASGYTVIERNSPGYIPCRWFGSFSNSGCSKRKVMLIHRMQRGVSSETNSVVLGEFVIES